MRSSVLVIVLSILSASDVGGATPSWQEFVTARAAGVAAKLPDFSFAGYRFSNEPLPEVSTRSRRSAPRPRDR